MVDYSQLPNALQGFAQGYGVSQGIRDDHEGYGMENALAAGSRGGRGRGGGGGSGAAPKEPSATEVQHKLDMLENIRQTIAAIPDEDGQQTHRKAALARFNSTFEAMGLPTQVIQAFGQDLTDQGLAALAIPGKQNVTPFRAGSHVQGIDTRTGQQVWQHDLPTDAASSTRIPFGWTVDEDGNPTPIDSFVRGKARLSGATRAPRASRGGGSHPGYGGLPPGYRPK